MSLSDLIEIDLENKISYRALKTSSLSVRAVSKLMQPAFMYPVVYYIHIHMCVCM